jgi:hypothetical protein
VIERFLLHKSKQPKADLAERAAHLARFELD